MTISYLFDIEYAHTRFTRWTMDSEWIAFQSCKHYHEIILTSENRASRV